MTDLVVKRVEATAKSWREEAQKRRGISKADPVADTLEYCAGEMTATLRALVSEARWMTVEQFAADENVTPQTVRSWIRAGRITAFRRGAKGYQIAKDAKVLPRVLEAKAS